MQKTTSTPFADGTPFADASPAAAAYTTIKLMRGRIGFDDCLLNPVCHALQHKPIAGGDISAKVSA